MIDKILSTNFARKANETVLITQANRPCVANVFRCLLEEIDRMARSCQLTEFTDHGLPHLLSVINRIDTWTIKDGSNIIKILSHDETCLLFFAVIIHDIGMLSQRESDLSKVDQIAYTRQFADLAGWVRRTHTLRIPGILRRILENNGFSDFIHTNHFETVCELACSHNYWPDSNVFRNLSYLDKKNRLRVLAAILAVADLLDEDSSRCDSMTLFSNKVGTLLNRAHWLRHMLTANCLKIEKGMIRVSFQEPINLRGRIEGAFVGLENHLNQCRRYNPILLELNAEIDLVFGARVNCERFPEDDELAMLYCQPNIHILRTFQNDILPRATKDKPEGTETIVDGIKLKTVNREIFDVATGADDENISSGRVDYEITYLASLKCGEKSRQFASGVLQKIGWQLFERGEIIEIRRLSRFVLEETTKMHKDEKSPLLDDNIYWAVVFLIHWASDEGDLRLISSLFDDSSMYSYIDPDKLVNEIDLPWKIIALTCYFIIQPFFDRGLSLFEQIIDEQISKNQSIKPEIALAWHSLIEALWGRGYFNVESEKIWVKVKRLQEMEADSVHSILKELSWRMSVQSQCLKGLKRWQFIQIDYNRVQHNLKSEPARESLAKYWLSWANGREFNVEEVRNANQKGSEFYISALEAERLSIHLGTKNIAEQIKKINSNMRRLREARENDESVTIMNKMAARLLSENHEPKKENTTYLYKRDVELLPIELFIGERIALRRWFLEGWLNLISINIQRILNLAYSLSVEDEDVSEAIVFCLSEIAWISADKKTLEKLAKILELNDTKLSFDLINNLIQQIFSCPPQICRINHPGLQLLGDMINPELVPELIRLTNERLQLTNEFSAQDYKVWLNIFPLGVLSPEQWRFLNDLIVTCLSWPNILGSDSKQICYEFFRLAPWEQVAIIIEDIVETFESGEMNPDCFLEIKDGLVMSIINREDESWKDSFQIRKLISILRNSNNDAKKNNGDIFLAKWLEYPHAEHNEPLYEDLTISIVEQIENIVAKAVSRGSNRSFSFGGSYPHILAKLPPVPNEIAIRSAKALNRIWNAKYTTYEELESACILATYNLKSSNGEGFNSLLDAFFKGMESYRLVCDIGGEKDGSEVPWKYISYNLEDVSELQIDRLYKVVVSRIIDLPEQAAGAIAACLVEISMRAPKAEIRNSAYIMLYSLRVKVSKYDKFNSDAYVRAVQRYVTNLEKGYLNQNISEFLIEWSGKAIICPNVNYRYNVALAIRKLLDVISNKDKKNLELIITPLKNDLHLKIRSMFYEDGVYRE